MLLAYTIQQQNIVRTCPSDSVKGDKRPRYRLHIKLVRHIVIHMGSLHVLGSLVRDIGQSNIKTILIEPSFCNCLSGDVIKRKTTYTCLD